MESVGTVRRWAGCQNMEVGDRGVEGGGQEDRYGSDQSTNFPENYAGEVQRAAQNPLWGSGGKARPEQSQSRLFKICCEQFLRMHQMLPFHFFIFF